MPPPGSATMPPPGPQAALPVQRMIESSFAAERKLDALIRAAGAGKTFSAAELIALQAEVFRYSQVVELLSRTTDKVVGAVETIIDTYLRVRRDDERFLDTYRRVGLKPFKERLYAAH